MENIITNNNNDLVLAFYEEGDEELFCLPIIAWHVTTDNDSSYSYPVTIESNSNHENIPILNLKTKEWFFSEDRSHKGIEELKKEILNQKKK